MTKNGKSALILIKSSFVNWHSNCENLQKVTQLYPRPWFDDEEEAYSELKKIVNETIVQVEEKFKFNARFKFIRFNIPILFLQEAPSYQLFWQLEQPNYVREIIKKYEDNAAMVNRIFYKYDANHTPITIDYIEWLNNRKIVI